MRNYRQPAHYFALLCVGIGMGLLQACSIGQVKVWIDNPTSLPMEIDLGDHLHAVPADTLISVWTTPGRLQVLASAQGELILEPTEVLIEEEGLLNVGGESYVIWNFVYSEDGAETEEQEGSLVMIDEQSYLGNIQLLSDTILYIPKSWDLGLNEAFPDEVESHERGSLSRTKIFRKEAFKAEYKGFYQLRD